MAIAVATNTAPSQWWHEDDATIATAVELLVARAERKR